MDWAWKSSARVSKPSADTCCRTSDACRTSASASRSMVSRSKCSRSNVDVSPRSASAAASLQRSRRSCIFVFFSFLGRPNAGKSTLLNRIVGHKLAIVSDKPQTTRTRILGEKNHPEGQVVFFDTPGVHKPTHRMNVRMVDIALESMREVDVLCLVVDASAKAGPGDRYLLNAVKDVKTSTVLALNKVDLIAKPKLLPIIDHYQREHS